jgi:hypothetical protein
MTLSIVPISVVSYHIALDSTIHDCGITHRPLSLCLGSDIGNSTATPLCWASLIPPENVKRKHLCTLLLDAASEEILLSTFSYLSFEIYSVGCQFFFREAMGYLLVPFKAQHSSQRSKFPPNGVFNPSIADVIGGFVDVQHANYKYNVCP